MKPIVTIAREYAERTFTREFLETTTDSWYFDALDVLRMPHTISMR